MTLAALYALAMAWLGFAHQPLAGPPPSTPFILSAAYALPDGSIPELCLPDEGGSPRLGHFVACEACLVAGGHGPLTVAPTVAQPTARVLATLVITPSTAPKPVTRDRARARAPPVA